MQRDQREFLELKRIFFQEEGELRRYALRHLIQQDQKIPEQEFQTQIHCFPANDSSFYHLLAYATRISQKCANQILMSALSEYIESDTPQLLLPLLPVISKMELNSKNLKLYINLLTNLLGVSQKPTQIKLLSVLDPYHESIPSRFFLSLCKHDSKAVIQESLRQMSCSPKKEYEMVFQKWSQSKDHLCIAYACTGLWKLGNCALLSTYIRAGTKLKKVLLTQLHQCGSDPTLIKILLREIQSPDYGIRNSAFLSLAKLREVPNSMECLVHILQKPCRMDSRRLFKEAFESNNEDMINAIENIWDWSNDKQDSLLSLIQCLDEVKFLHQNWNLIQGTRISQSIMELSNQTFSNRTLNSLLPFMAALYPQVSGNPKD